ncbi:MAG: GTP-binding protein [Ardenticatenaceae bacterium]|nr:GTP-binding protein [Ardenticatenaceae bacterium]
MSSKNEISRIPVTILTGFLGAGKTTLLNHLLHGDHGRRIAVLVNDFGAVNIDAQLIVGVEGEDTVNLANGCICCTIRDDLYRAALQICQRPDPPEYILVETSGVSDPLAVAQTFTHTALSRHVYVEAILTMVDAEQYEAIPRENQVLALDQIGMADIVVLNKVDLVTLPERVAVEERIRFISPKARILATKHGQVPLGLVLGTGLQETARDYGRSSHDVHVHAAPNGNDHTHDHDHEHDHEHDDHTLLFHTWHYEEKRPFHFKSLQKMVNNLPLSIYRAKGFIHLNEAPDRKCTLHVVGKRARLVVSEPWGKLEPTTSLVFIGLADGVPAQALAEQFEACLLENQPPATPLRSAINWVRDAWQLAASS